MTPVRRSRGRPSKGPRRTIRVPVTKELRALITAQTETEGLQYWDALMADVVTTNWDGWASREPLSDDAARLLSVAPSGGMHVRVPDPIGTQIVETATSAMSAGMIVAELLARHLPERRRRYRAADAPQQEELAL